MYVVVCLSTATMGISIVKITTPAIIDFHHFTTIIPAGIVFEKKVVVTRPSRNRLSHRTIRVLSVHPKTETLKVCEEPD